jgi:hypothetical protein
MDGIVENCPPDYLPVGDKCRGPCPADSIRVGDQCEKNGKFTKIPKTFMSTEDLFNWRKNQSALDAANSIMISSKDAMDEFLKNNPSKGQKYDKLKHRYESAKAYVLDEMNKTSIPLPPDEWANWQASLEFDAKKPADFTGISNPYYTNFTFMRTLTRLPIMEVEFIRRANFVKAPVWPLIPRIGKYDHRKNNEYIQLYLEANKLGNKI